MDPVSIAISVGTAIAAAGGSWGAAKATLNGTRERTERIENKLDKHIDDSQQNKLEVAQRLAKIETKLED